MAAAPELAPDNSDHLLRTSSIVSKISYQTSRINYNIFDNSSEDLFRLTSKPKKVLVNGTKLQEVTVDDPEGWSWQSLPKGGILKIKQSKGNKLEINK
jgi:archaellum component FlaG (FlaF/FlaG flagellin family)